MVIVEYASRSRSIDALAPRANGKFCHSSQGVRESDSESERKQQTLDVWRAYTPHSAAISKGMLGLEDL